MNNIKDVIPIITPWRSQSYYRKSPLLYILNL